MEWPYQRNGRVVWIGTHDDTSCCTSTLRHADRVANRVIVLPCVVRFGWPVDSATACHL